ncbi:MAG: hypothetical protein KI786_12410 [Mameliella sp.]|nr:hypothetical protein [Phaeodactylibacter sp.]
MHSNVPVVRQIGWWSVVPQLLVLALILWVWYQFTPADFLIYGALTYLLLSLLLRRGIAKDHRKRMAAVRKGNFRDAIIHFEHSYAFFHKNEILDRYRYLTLLSSSKMSYEEMALTNIAFCYGQLGEGEKAKAIYEQTLDAFPENGIAKSALRLMNSISGNQEEANN